MVISEEWSATEWKFLVDKCLNDGWKTFYCKSKGVQCNTDDFVTIANKCSNLKALGFRLNIGVMQSWPVVPSPWTSLRHIYICSARFGGVFEHVELQMTLPNLERIMLQELGDNNNIMEPSFLPDLEGCDKLELAVFNQGFFRFNGDILPGDKIPLPPGLKSLNLKDSRFHEEFMNQIKYEDIKKILPGLQFLNASEIIPEHLLL